MPLAPTSILIKTEDGREALAARRSNMQMRQRHLLILIDGARTVGQLHQLLSDWPDVDALLAGLQQAGMIHVLSGALPAKAPAAGPSTVPFDPIVHFNRPLFADTVGGARDTQPVVHDEPPPLAGMTPGLEAVAAPVDAPVADTPTADVPSMAPPEPSAAPQPLTAPVAAELTDVLPNVVKVELMRLALHHLGSAAGAAIPLLRACAEDTESLCHVIAACARAAAPTAGEQAAARFLDAAMHAMAHRR